MGEGGFVDDRARSYFWARHVAFCAETFGDLVFGWKPINEPGAYVGDLPHGGRSPRRSTGARCSTCSAACCSRSATRGASCAAAASRSRRSTTSRRSSRVGQTVQTTNDRARARRGHRGTCGCAPIATVCSSSPDACRARFRTCGKRATSSASRTTRAIGVDDEGRHRRRTRPNARVGPMGYAPWSEGLGIVMRRLHDELPGRPLLICEHGVGTDDDEWRCDILRESLAHRRRRDRRRHRRARLLPLDRRRQLRVEPRLRRAVRRVHARPRTPRQRRAPPRLRHRPLSQVDGFGDNRRPRRS